MLADLAALAANHGVRLGVVGGSGTLHIGEHGPLVKDTDHVPAEYKAEAEEMGTVLQDLKTYDAESDWFYISPAAGFGSWAPGTATGKYRIGGDRLLVDANGKSEVSGADLADAVLKEIETPTHRNSRFTMAY